MYEWDPQAKTWSLWLPQDAKPVLAGCMETATTLPQGAKPQLSKIRPNKWAYLIPKNEELVLYVRTT